MIRSVSEELPDEQPRVIIEEVSDPEGVARSRRVLEQARRNMDWLQSHWPELLPRALGKFVAVAGQEAFIGDSSEEATALARAAHPDDQGLLIHYLLLEQGARIYGNCR